MPSTHAPAHRERTTTIPTILARVLFLGAVLAVAAFSVPVMIQLQQWMWLSIVVLATIAIFALYSTKRFVPGKYLFPGTLFLVVFLITPIILTIGYSFTNFGDGTRGTKEQAIDSIVANSVQQSDDSTWYNLSVATQGDPVEGPFTLFLVDPGTGTVYQGDETAPVQEVPSGDVEVTSGFVTDADGYTILDAREVNTAYDTIQQLAVPITDSEAVRIQGANQAFEGSTVLSYDEASDTLTDSRSGEVYSVGTVGDTEYFVNADGERAFSQSWLQGVGLSNYERLFTNAGIAKQFGAAFVWTLVFSLGSVLLTFVVGFALALVLNDERVKGRRLYRSVLLMPYAVPGFISLLVWSNFYNRDFGLINETLGMHLNWMGDPTLAKAAVLLTNLWMGFPYMFIVSTGALQSIPSDVMEAARMDGASRLQTTIKVVTPLLLVAVAPLLVASFAFNFNNFNAIQLLTEGGPFLPGEYTRGGTDILISMIYRIAFGGSGADFGFASAVSVALFALTGVLAAIQFRFTTVLEDVN
ncbi:ABC transporter permease subunit [Brachybacterium alimentarium]|uniref:Maltose/maltodextrin transport system permease protein n=1 Tax=Brachybacterium alimentarium TaxID=47845 RepID=A0A2A3YJQ7_9MICO|nr:ABC transporter permease subunit [Brachybacterium alimentarium]PCC39576.1 sugar ABC transporter permease [Brachybacterium alimentarium]RCS81892.1 ABC transporter permease subunit [Brachybacterium alimentarium]